MITIIFLTNDFRGNASSSNRNNKEWLVAQDKRNGTFNIAAPYPKSDYFRRTFIEPILDDDGFILKEKFDVPLVTCDGISYCIKKFHKRQTLQDSQIIK